MAVLIVIVTSAIIMASCLLLHYEILRVLFAYSPRLKHRPRTRVGLVLAALILSHLVEIWVFGLGYYMLDRRADIGSIQGSVTGFLDYVYFSAVVYATIVFGEYIPVGHLRFLVAMEAFTGLFMITWSAVFLFGLMHDFWSEQAGRNAPGEQPGPNRT